MHAQLAPDGRLNLADLLPESKEPAGRGKCPTSSCGTPRRATSHSESAASAMCRQRWRWRDSIGRPCNVCLFRHSCFLYLIRHVLHICLKRHTLRRVDYLIQSPGQLSSHLRALRKAQGLSQQQLGAMLGVGQTRIARIERDPTSISVDQFLGIFSALEVQMILRPMGSRSGVATAAGSSAAAAGGPAATARKRRDTTDEPW